MGEAASNRNELGPELTPGQRVTRFAVGVLFYLILLIPRVRRLRRRVALWTVLRILAAHAGLWVIWFYRNDHGWGSIAAAALLMGFALLVGATPVTKSLDDRARELGALAVLNGGRMSPSPGVSAQSVYLFAGPEQLTVVSAARQICLQIPVAQIHSCHAHSSAAGEGKPWDLEITWGREATQSTLFHFEGFFAEHLARVAETAIENLRRPELPVLGP